MRRVLLLDATAGDPVWRLAEAALAARDADPPRNSVSFRHNGIVVDIRADDTLTSALRRWETGKAS